SRPRRAGAGHSPQVAHRPARDAGSIAHRAGAGGARRVLLVPVPHARLELPAHRGPDGHGPQLDHGRGAEVRAARVWDWCRAGAGGVMIGALRSSTVVALIVAHWHWGLTYRLQAERGRWQS